MKMTIELRDADPEDDGRDARFVCEAKAGDVTVLRFPPVSTPEGRVIDLSIPMVDFVAEYTGCYTPGQALRVFAEALDTVLACDGWEKRADGVPVESVGSPHIEADVVDDRAEIRITTFGPSGQARNKARVRGCFPIHIDTGACPRDLLKVPYYDGAIVTFLADYFTAEGDQPNDQPIPHNYIRVASKARAGSPPEIHLVIPWDELPTNLRLMTCEALDLKPEAG